MKLYNHLKNFVRKNNLFKNLTQINKYIKRKPKENLRLSRKYSKIRQESINLWNEYLVSTDEVPFFVSKLSEESISNLHSLFDDNFSTERELNVSAIYPGYFTNEELLIASHLGHSKSIDLVASLEYFRELNNNGWNLLEKIIRDIRNDLRKFSNKDVIFFQARLPIVRPYIESKRIQSNIKSSPIEEQIFRNTTAYIDHTDGWPLKMNKIIIYPNGASKEIGTTEIVLPNGKRQTVNCESGGYVNFQNSVTTHKAVPGNSNIERKSIQLSYFFSPLDRPSTYSIVRTPHFSNFPSTPREIDHEVKDYQKDICQKIESNLKIFYDKYKS